MKLFQLGLIALAFVAGMDVCLASPTTAVAFHQNPAHDGVVNFDRAPTYPLPRAWTYNVGGSMSYPLIADGKAFITASTSASYGSTLMAIDLKTGTLAWGPIGISGTYFSSYAAYDNGKLYVVNYDGLLREFDAATGAAGWAVQLPRQWSFNVAPTAVDGRIYVSGAGGGSTLYAVDARNGTILWMRSVSSTEPSSPAVSGQAIYASFGCGYVFKFDKATGLIKWRHTDSCSRGGGGAVVYANDKLYARGSRTGSGLVLDARTGAVQGSFSASHIPAVTESMLYTVFSGELAARDLLSGVQAWTFQGAGPITIAPLVLNGNVLVATENGHLYALAGDNGALVWETTLPGNVPGSYEGSGTQLLNGLSAGAGLILVPVSQQLVAYGTYEADTTPPTVKLSARPATVFAGNTTTLSWSSAHARRCTASGAWAGPLGVSGVQEVVVERGVNRFELSCDGDSGSASTSKRVRGILR